MRLLVLFLAIILNVFAQSAPRAAAVYTYSKTGTGNMAITFQAPASGGRIAQFDTATVYCSVAGTLDQFRHGSAASSTADTLAAVNPDISPVSEAKLTVFHTSNSSTASAQVLPPVDVFAGAPGVALDLSDIQIAGNGTTKNYTLSLTCSGTYRISVKLREYSN